LVVKSPDPHRVELDEIDKAIIRELQVDGRTPYAKLGPAVGLSQAAVRQRVQRLVERHAVQVVAVTDPFVLGFGVMAMVGVETDGPARPVADALGAEPEVEYVVLTAGRYDLLVEVVCESHDDLLRLLDDRIRSVPGVRRAEPFTYLDITKQTYAWGTR
ncbi:MAG TPA: Lrp/AsnC family transcriptional regulator, partial [Acidimicrobiales bacterium]|nr:Lrp/AsnC family transcriptional regulator [Acidimicrobiales bacterium]